MNITIKTGECRFGGAGDWSSYDSITVRELGDWRMEFLVAIHELVEAQLCKAAGVTAEDVDNFDRDFIGSGEPGDSVHAPYAIQHAIATEIEEILCEELGIDWDEYEREISREDGGGVDKGVLKLSGGKTEVLVDFHNND